MAASRSHIQGTANYRAGKNGIGNASASRAIPAADRPDTALSSPAPLPPVPPIDLAGELQVLLSQADRALGRLDGSIKTLPNPDLFVFMYVRKEAVLSSQIEGTQSSLQDVLDAEAKILAADRPQDAEEVIDYIRTMNSGIAQLDVFPVSVRLIREIHAKLPGECPRLHLTPGELRTSQNWIWPGGCTLNEATFVPPPPGSGRSDSLSDVEQFLHTDAPPAIAGKNRAGTRAV